MAFYTAASHLNLARTPDVFTNAFTLQSCQGSSTSYSASHSTDAAFSSSDSFSSNPTSPYSYKTSRSRTHPHLDNSAMNATSSSNSSTAAGSSIRGAADLLQNTFALASKPWRTASSSSLATASASGLKQEAMLTPPMTSTFSSRTMMGGASAGSGASAGMGYGDGAAANSGSTLAPALTYPGSGSGAATLATPTSMVVEEATISANTSAVRSSDESHSHHQTQPYHHPHHHQQSQPHPEYRHHSSYQHPPPPQPQNHHQYQQDVSSHQQQQRMTLPPIAHLERHLSHLPPLTPPADLPLPQIQIALPPQSSGIPSTQTQVPIQVPLPSQTRVQVPLSKPSQQEFYQSTSTRIESSPADAMPIPVPTSSHPPQQSSELHKHQPQAVQPNYVVDWLDFTRTRSAHFIAEKTCEMICYLWFATPSSGSGVGKSIETPPATPPSESAVVSNGSDALFASPVSLPAVTPSSAGNLPKPTNSAPSTLQLRATPTFVSFMQKLLETTQVSQSVIVLSLHYIYRLKERNQYTPAQPGSEFRIAVAGLMMGNKFLDDNTYTNKTWSEVSGIDLSEINHMEREFLLGVDFNLYVDKATYEAWLNLLKGLVLAKERDCQRFGSGARSHRHGRMEGRDRMGRAGDSRAEREREREREERKRKLYGSTGPASRTYTTANITSSTNSNTRSTAAYRGTHHRARSTSPTLRMSSSTSAAVLSVAPTTSGQTAAVYLPYPPAQQQQPVGYGPPPATAPSGYYPPASGASASSSTYAAYASQNQSQDQSQAQGSYASSTTYAPVQQAYQTSSSATSHQQYSQHRHHTPSHGSTQAPAPMPVSLPAYIYPSTTPYASYPSGTSSAYTSPSPAPASVAPLHHITHAHPAMHITTAIPRSGSKRTAEAAFSPTSASFAQEVSLPPTKTRSVRLASGSGISLRIPDVVTSGQGSSAGGSSASPLEGLGSFEKMNLGGNASRGASPTREREEREERERERERERQRGRESVLPKTLSSKYSYSNDGRRGAGPQNLYFYTLACSPLKPEPAPPVNRDVYLCNPNSDAKDMKMESIPPPIKEDGAGYGYRKARLRYHQPVLPSNAPYAYADLNASRGVGAGVGVYNASSSSFNPYAAPIPSVSGWPVSQQQQQHLHPYNHQSQHGTRLVVQSAATSPALLQSSHTSASSGALPHFRDDVWARPPAPAYPTQTQNEEEDSEEEEEEEEDEEDDEMEAEDEDDKQMSYTGPGAYTESPLTVHRQAPPPTNSSAPSSKSSSTSTVMYAPRTPPLAPAHHNYHQVQHAAHNAQYDRTPPSARIPSAPFANAGPPGVGVMFYEDGSPLRPLQYVQSHTSAAGSAVSGGYAYQPPATSAGYPTSTHGQQSYAYAYGNGYGHSYGR